MSHAPGPGPPRPQPRSRWRLGAAAAALTALVALPLVAAATDRHGDPRGPSGQGPRGREGTRPGRAVELVTVTATRLPRALGELPAPVRVWDGELLRRLPTLVLDDALREHPALSLYRRTSSRAAHPTSQGLHLRGLAPSGVSRALFMVDGVPANDPFGGWVYWDRVPMLAVERVEVAPGGGSAPFGSQALAGVVQVVTRRAEATGFQLQALAGSDGTLRGGLAAGKVGRTAGLLATAEAFHTDGYVAVLPPQRGAVDGRAGSSHQALRLRLDRRRSGTLVAEGFREARANGTRLQRNATRLAGLSGSWRGAARGPLGGWSLHGFARTQRFRSTFSRIAADRGRETLVLRQRVPSWEVGGRGQGWLPLGARGALALGADLRWLAGRSEETVVLARRQRRPGGRQRLSGAYAAFDGVLGSRIGLDLALRADGWRQRPTGEPGASRGASTISPRAGALWRLSPSWAVRAAAYRAFRAPTLNELYRQFRVGNVVTRANPDLEEERLRGAEVGLDWEPGDPRRRLRIRSTVYWNVLDGAIVNATLSVSPDLVLRRRANVGRARVRGLELEAGVGLGRGWRLDAAVAWIDARIVGQPDPARSGQGPRPLAGNRLPQVPAVRGSARIAYGSPGGWGMLALLRAAGAQFEDDRNLLPLAGALTLDAAVEVPLAPGLGLTLRAENLLDHRVPVARTPILRMGPPRLLYGGFTVAWPAARP